MNPDTPQSHPSFIYYDSDYPSRELSPYPENFDETTKLQGLYSDVDRFIRLAKEVDGSILEVCCGSGRVAIPLAQAGFSVTAIDVSSNMLDQFTKKLENVSAEARERIELIHQDATCLDLPKIDFNLAIVPFNSLMCIPSASDQLKLLHSIARHTKEGARLLLDLVNPFAMDPQGIPNPVPFFTRRNVHNGNLYTRFASFGPVQTDQTQELKGWYDEIAADGTLKRKLYSMTWRLIYPQEIEMMLEQSGFKVVQFEGGHDGESFTPNSRKMNVLAVRSS